MTKFKVADIDELLDKGKCTYVNNGCWDKDDFKVGEKITLIHYETKKEVAVKVLKKYEDAMVTVQL